MNTILQTINLKKYYGEGENIVKAIDNTNINIFQGEFVAIVGKSGSGKSTLLHMLGALDKPTSGEVIIDNKYISTMKEEELAIFRRRKIGFIFQYYNLIPSINVWENIVLPIGLDSRRVDKDFVNDILDTLGLKEKKHNMPNTLSGVQQQRVAIARALASKPSIILADEPTGALDSKSAKVLLESMEKLNKDLNATIMMVTHDAFTASYADRILFIKDGKIFNELIKGNDSRNKFFDRIIDVITLLGGDVRDVC